MTTIPATKLAILKTAEPHNHAQPPTERGLANGSISHDDLISAGPANGTPALRPSSTSPTSAARSRLIIHAVYTQTDMRFGAPFLLASTSARAGPPALTPSSPSPSAATVHIPKDSQGGRLLTVCTSLGNPGGFASCVERNKAKIADNFSSLAGHSVLPLQPLCRLPTHRVAAAGALTFQYRNDRPYCASADLNHLSILWPDRQFVATEC